MDGKIGRGGAEFTKTICGCSKRKNSRAESWLWLKSLSVFVFFFGKKIIITRSFLKKSGRILAGEIERAERSMRDFLRRHEGGEIEL